MVELSKIERKITTPDTELQHLPELGNRLLTPKKNLPSKNFPFSHPAFA